MAVAILSLSGLHLGLESSLELALINYQFLRSFGVQNVHSFFALSEGARARGCRVPFKRRWQWHNITELHGLFFFTCHTSTII